VCSCESCPAIPITPNATTGPVEIPETNDSKTISYECNGCSLDKKCYPFGFRTNSNYCDNNSSTFISQKTSDSSCNNNFECSSNVCVSGKCVDSGLMQRIINWFKSLFGIK
jgi:hypothetical protein